MSFLLDTSKLVGVALLGLLAGDLLLHAYETIPGLISSLSHLVTLQSSPTPTPHLENKVTDSLVALDLHVLGLTALSSTLLLIAYFVASPAGKHPYLLYAAVTAPVALGLNFAANWSIEGLMVDKLRVLRTFEEEGDNAKTRTAMAVADEKAKVEPEHSDEDSLTRSYIHVSDEDEPSSATLTPSGGSPLVSTADELQQEISIEEEIQIVLLRKEIAQDLEKLKAGLVRGGAAAGLGFAVATVGLLGEYFIV